MPNVNTTQVGNIANSGRGNSQFPGLSYVISSWLTAQNLTGNYAGRMVTNLASVASLIGRLPT
jgi:hypothetical protein